MSALFNWPLDSVTDCVCVAAQRRQKKEKKIKGREIAAVAGGAEWGEKMTVVC